MRDSTGTTFGYFDCPFVRADNRHNSSPDQSPLSLLRHKCNQLQRFANRQAVAGRRALNESPQDRCGGLQRRHWRAGRRVDVLEDLLAGRRAIVTSQDVLSPAVERAGTRRGG